MKNSSIWFWSVVLISVAFMVQGQRATAQSTTAWKNYIRVPGLTLVVADTAPGEKSDVERFNRKLEIQPECPDVNKDGRVDAVDVTLVIQFIFGIDLQVKQMPTKNRPPVNQPPRPSGRITDPQSEVQQ